MEKMNEIVTIGGLDCYEENGTAYLKLETVARGLGFTQEKNGAEYVRWDRLEEYLSELGFPTSGERTISSPRTSSTGWR